VIYYFKYCYAPGMENYGCVFVSLLLCSLLNFSIPGMNLQHLWQQ
jgi:hypothetical protein